MKKILMLVVIALSSFLCTAQETKKIVELKKQLKHKQDTSARIETLLEISRSFLYGTEVNKNHIDSAMVYCDHAKKLSTQIKYHRGFAKYNIIQSRIQYVQGNVDKAREIALKVINGEKKTNAHETLGDAYRELNNYYDYGPDNDLKIKYSENAVSEYRKGTNKKALADGLGELSMTYFSIEQYNKCIIIGLEALEVYNQIKLKGEVLLYSVMGMSYNYLGIHQESIRYELMGAKLGEENGDESTSMGILYNSIGMSYFNLQNYALAQKYHEKGYEYAVINKDTYLIYTIASNIVNAMLFQKKYKEADRFFNNVIQNYKPGTVTEKFTIKRRLQNINLKLRKYGIAKKYTDEMFSTAKEAPEELGEIGVFIMHECSIEYYLAIKNFNEAQKHLKIIDQHARKGDAKTFWKRIYNWGFKIDSAQGNYVSAIKNYQKYKAVNDSIIDESKGNLINLMQIQYETEKKDKDINEKAKNIQLLTEQKKLQDEKIEKDRVTRLIIIAFSGLLILIIALLYNRYRIKQKNQRILETKQKELELKQAEIETKNIKLQNLVSEKEWLLKEIHHRVKNNLQIVMSLLNTQSAYLEDKVALTAIRDSQHRVHSMSLIHQKLYKSDNMAAINMPEYINELTQYLKDSFDLARYLTFEMDVEDMDMDVSQAVPLGLILNEAITNAIKYAFPGNSEGIISISLQNSVDDYFILKIADNGVGLPHDFDNRKINSLGMRLMNGLSGDLDGIFKIYNEIGTVVSVEFEYRYHLTDSHS
ncbi:hypothetical protein GR160_04605 [Flavobacterium sp. Sd200]|uniref:histidine kinase dimerization/phosphoacceptor domain -containing protein n=1 Tax=Flavobacterium sp. Sd200 TaxID=2692211 RepID=UPI00136A5C09|nr:histidine kinase dimerization/phosphoacceptor domain -containing protein [Flavobacterium sp. Sd200]MXN90500.1 hypothetical protein [Flavobacterium sp. Sd200]